MKKKKGYQICLLALIMIVTNYMPKDTQKPGDIDITSLECRQI